MHDLVLVELTWSAHGPKLDISEYVIKNRRRRLALTPRPSGRSRAH
jgi:hypothetical protein